MSEPDKRLFFKTPDVSKMSREEIDAWAKQLHKQIVAELRPTEAEPDDSADTDPSETEA